MAWKPGKFLNQAIGKVEKTENSSQKSTEVEGLESEINDKEYVLRNLLKYASNKFVERKWFGTISISRLNG